MSNECIECLKQKNLFHKLSFIFNAIDDMESEYLKKIIGVVEERKEFTNLLSDYQVFFYFILIIIFLRQFMS